MTNAEKREYALKVADRFAERGIIALWGGVGPRGKGNGFWLYQTTPEEVAKFWKSDKGFYKMPGHTIENYGQRSGNPYFWMMKDALTLLQ